MNIPKIKQKELPAELSSNHKWVESEKNHTLMGEGFYVSYVPNNWEGHPETAIVDEESRTLRALEGDYRKDYETLVPQGLGRCIEFYESKRVEFDSVFSTDCERADRWEKRYKALMKTLVETQERVRSYMEKNPGAAKKIFKQMEDIEK